MAPFLSLLSCELSVPVKENPDRKKAHFNIANEVVCTTTTTTTTITHYYYSFYFAKSTYLKEKLTKINKI